MPVVQVRVARSLARYGRGRRNAREEVAELVQDTFRLLLEDEGRVLRAWKPDGGLSLENFVGLVAERHARSIVKTRKRSPWTEQPVLDIDALMPASSGPEAEVASKDLLAVAFRAVENALTPKGLALFEALVVQQRAAAEVAESLSMSVDAVYQWRSRLLSRVRAELRAHAATPPTEPGRVAREG